MTWESLLDVFPLQMSEASIPTMSEIAKSGFGDNPTFWGKWRHRQLQLRTQHLVGKYNL